MRERPSNLPPSGEGGALEPDLRRRLSLARRALLWQRLWPALWPAAAVLGTFLVVALFDIPRALPPWLHAALLVAFAGALGLCLVRAASRGRRPTDREVQRYLEAGSAAAHRPVTALRDRLAGGRGRLTEETLWAIHRARMRRAAARLRVRWPRAGWLGVDPWGLRAALGALLVAALVVAGDEAPGRLARAVVPDLSGSVKPARLDIWITPPAHTGVAPIFLGHGQDDRAIPVPIDSIITAQVSEGRGTPLLRIGAKETPLAEAGGKLWRLEAPIRDGDRIVVSQGKAELGAWAMAVIADQPPQVRFSGPPRRTVRAALRLDFEASDDYGVAELKARITRVPSDGAPPRPDSDAAIEIDLTGAVAGIKEIKTATYHDLTPHPWAGLLVEYRLEARDAAGQLGVSEPVRAELPERVFNHPVARAMIEQRKRLASEPERRRDIALSLWGLGNLPGLYGDDVVVFLALRSAANRLILNEDERATAEVQGLIWDTALRLEDGEVSLAEREIRDLRQQLQEALNRNAPDEEIRRLIDRIREAIDRYLEALARAPQTAMPDDLSDEDPGEIVTRDDLQRMLDQMQRLSQTGARDSARQMLDRLAQMLENLRAMRPNQMRQARRGDTQQMMRRLEELARQQQRLLDQTFRQSREANGETQWLRGSQEELRRELGDLMRMLGDRLGEIPQGLGEADQAMRDALRALGEGNAGQAVGPQTQALDRLRQGVGQALRQLSGQDGEDGEAPEGIQEATGQDEGVDPLGRETDGRGTNVEGQVEIPSESEITRSRQILDELRRRAADPWRPALERDYIERLLERF